MKLTKSKTTAIVLTLSFLFTAIPAAPGFAEDNGTYSQHFEHDLLQDWTEDGGNWEVGNGYYSVNDLPETASPATEQRSPQPPEHANDNLIDVSAASIYEGASWNTDFSYTVSMYSGYAEDNNGMGAIFNYQDKDNYYEVWFAPVGKAELHKIIDGEKEVIATASYAGGGRHMWINVDIIRKKDATTTVRVNSRTIFSNIPQTELGDGKIGVFANWNTARFDDVSVIPGEVSPYKATFPKIGGMYISATPTHDYSVPEYQKQLAQHDAIILGFWRGWKHNGKTVRQSIQEIKSYNPDVLIGKYTDVMESTTNTRDTAKLDVYNKLSNEVGPNGKGDWWARDNTGKPVSSFGGTWNTNITSFVTPDANGDQFPQWYAKRMNELYYDPMPELDIWYSDNMFYRPRVDPDWDGDGINDSKNNPTVRTYYRQAIASYLDTAKKLQPRILVMGNVDGSTTEGFLREKEYSNKYPAAFYEAAMGKNYSIETWNTWENTMKAYSSLMDNTIDPKIVMFNVAGSSTNYSFMRYGLGSALLEDGYFSYSTDGVYHGVSWFDEFDVNLGKAAEGPQRSPWSNGVYRRHFQNGMVLVNPKGNGTQTVTIEPGYKRILGTQDPLVNNGQPVTSVTLNERDGIILIKE